MGREESGYLKVFNLTFFGKQVFSDLRLTPFLTPFFFSFRWSDCVFLFLVLRPSNCSQTNRKTARWVIRQETAHSRCGRFFDPRCFT